MAKNPNGKPPPNPTGIGLSKTGNPNWKKGVSANPGGRPKEKPFLHQLKHAIAIDDKDRLRKAADKLLTLAARGEPWAVQMLAERLDGRAPQDINVTREVREMSLDDILAELAEIRAAAGDGDAGQSIPKFSEIH